MTNIMTLEEACEVLTCGVASTPTYVDENIGIPFLSAQNVKDGLVVLDKYKYVSKDFHNHLTKKNKPRIKDILYSRVGSKFGEAAVVNFEFEFSVYVSLTLIRPKAFVDSYFLKYYLNSPIIKTLATKTIKSSGVPNLNVKDVRSFPISIPSLSEQQAIVEKLDLAFDAIEKAKANIEKNIENAKELFQSKLNAIFSQKGEGWEEKTLEKVSTIVNGYAFSSKDFSSESGVKSIKITNVGVKEFIFDDTNNLPISFLEKNKNVLVNEGDIVMALTRTIIAAGLKVAIVPKEYNLSLLNQRVVAIKESKHLSTQFLYYFLSSTIAKNYVLNHVNTLMQPNLSINDLKNMPISLPSLENQQILLTKLDELSSQTNFLKEKYKQKLANLEELKKSILEKAFKDKL